MGGKSHTRTVKSATAASPEQGGPQRDHSRDDWAYHGIGPIGSADGAAHIVVEDVVFGLTERKGIPVLRELAAPAYGGFSWGYYGAVPPGRPPRCLPTRWAWVIQITAAWVPAGRKMCSPGSAATSAGT